MASNPLLLGFLEAGSGLVVVPQILGCPPMLASFAVEAARILVLGILSSEAMGSALADALRTGVPGRVVHLHHNLRALRGAGPPRRMAPGEGLPTKADPASSARSPRASSAMPSSRPGPLRSFYRCPEPPLNIACRDPLHGGLHRDLHRSLPRMSDALRQDRVAMITAITGIKDSGYALEPLSAGVLIPGMEIHAAVLVAGVRCCRRCPSQGASPAFRGLMPSREGGPPHLPARADSPGNSQEVPTSTDSVAAAE